MNGKTADKLYQVCEEFLEGVGDASELYNILEGYAIQYIEEQEEE
jgi:hypothetical protein